MKSAGNSSPAAAAGGCDDFAAPARPSRAEAEADVRTLIRWAGDDPDREGLAGTPERVVAAFEEFYAGYRENPADLIGCSFADAAGYDDMVLVRDIPFHSHCEHHMVPFFGRAHVAYYPAGGVIGLSRFARLVDAFARRLQTQERLTAQIADAIETHLRPRGTAVMIEAEHMCMSMRGVQKQGSLTITTRFGGVFHDNPAEQARFFAQLRCGRDRAAG